MRPSTEPGYCNEYSGIFWDLILLHLNIGQVVALYFSLPSFLTIQKIGEQHLATPLHLINTLKSKSSYSTQRQVPVKAPLISPPAAPLRRRGHRGCSPLWGFQGTPSPAPHTTRRLRTRRSCRFRGWGWWWGQWRHHSPTSALLAERLCPLLCGRERGLRTKLTGLLPG